jgi:hypothetical protein
MRETSHYQRCRMHLVQALTRSDSEIVRDHLRAALRELDAIPPTPLVECRLCGLVGLPERIETHDCRLPPVEE